jgi:aspartate aminotransferase
MVLALRTAAVSESATLALNAQAKRLESEGRTIYNLTAGELNTDTPDYIQKAVAKKLRLNKYTPVAGLPELRLQISKQARMFYRLDWINPDNVVVTAGAKPALYAAFLALINPGDEVIVPTPAWVSYQHMIELVGGKVIKVPLKANFDLDTRAIQARITKRTKAIVINSPHNPTGAVFSKTALKSLALVLKGSSIIVIADDIYAKLVYEDSFTPTPSVGFEKIIIINGFSKSQALTGWRIGYLIAEDRTAQAATSMLSHIMGNAAVPSQEAALAALARHDKPPIKTLQDLNNQRRLVSQALSNISGLKFHIPGGAFYFFLDLRSITSNSTKWCEQLLAGSGVALVPGEAFSAPGFARLSFAVDKANLSKALELLAKFVKSESIN